MDKQQTFSKRPALYAGYGVHYHANYHLIHKTTDKVVFQYLIDAVRTQLRRSLSDTTILTSDREIGRVLGMDSGHTIADSLKRLESLGLVKNYPNAVKVMCDEYVAIVKYYETRKEPNKSQFEKDFKSIGVGVLEKYNIDVDLHHREELLGLSGSSITLEADKCCNSTSLQPSNIESDVILHQCCNSTSPEGGGIDVILHQFALSTAKMMENYSTRWSFEEFASLISDVNLHHRYLDAVQIAFLTGNWPKSFLDELKKCCNFTSPAAVILHHLASKVMEFYSTVIIEEIKKKNEWGQPPKNTSDKVRSEDEEAGDREEDFEQEIRKGFEAFSTLEPAELNFQPLACTYTRPGDDVEATETRGDSGDSSQLVLKRAERELRHRNPYRNKPFIQMGRIRDIVEYIEEEVKSPVEFFIHIFWDRIFDLYLDHYRPIERADEEGEPDEDSRGYCFWREMIGSPLPQDEVYRVAENAYEDLRGAVEQGRFSGCDDDGEWTCTFAFKDFEDFMPQHMFQWKPCRMQDRTTPALAVAIDRFYDIEAEDVTVSSRCDRKTRFAQNKKMTVDILHSEPSELTPLENAINAFYGTFVVQTAECMADGFKDEYGAFLEEIGVFPDHKLKPWCLRSTKVAYSDLTGALARKYRPMEGVRREAYLFSAQKVAEWNERNGYRDTVAHRAVREAKGASPDVSD